MIREHPSDIEPGEQPWFEAAGGARCPVPDTLAPALLGLIPEPLGGRVRAHIEACEACRVLADVLSEEGAGSPTDDQAGRIRRRLGATALWSRTRLAWAAAAVLVIAAASMVAVRFWPRATTSDVARRQADDRVLPPPEFVLVLEMPAVALPETALVTRRGAPDAYATALRTALTPYRGQRFAEAAAALADVERRFPGRPHASFYAGASLLLAGRAADAVAPLRRAREASGQNSWLTDESAWYLAIAFERSGDRASAAGILSTLCSGRGVRREAACRALQRLSRTSDPGERGGGVVSRSGGCVGADLVDRA